MAELYLDGRSVSRVEGGYKRATLWDGFALHRKDCLGLITQCPVEIHAAEVSKYPAKVRCRGNRSQGIPELCSSPSMETRNQTHPTPRQLAAFALGKLTPESRGRMQAHLADCTTCSTFLSQTPRDTLVTLLRQAAAGIPASDQSTPGIAIRQLSVACRVGAAHGGCRPAAGTATAHGAGPSTTDKSSEKPSEQKFRRHCASRRNIASPACWGVAAWARSTRHFTSGWIAAWRSRSSTLRWSIIPRRLKSFDQEVTGRGQAASS